MLGGMDSVFYKLHLLILSVGLLIIVSFLPLFLLLSVTDAHAMDTTESENPNVVARSMGSVKDAINARVRFAGLAMRRIGNYATSGGTHALRFAHSGMFFAVGTVSDGVTSVLEIPGDTLEPVENSTIVRAAIQPAYHKHVPTIDPASAKVLATGVEITAAKTAAQSNLPPASAPSAPAPAPQSDAQVTWPLHGAITTMFGASDLPYERVHTGLDISDGKAPGVTPIHPFKAGLVVEVIRSGGGLGNHVVVDHGAGLTSVYGHLASITVQLGQKVATTSIVGYEGSTGASTGTHLHFEIRINGQPRNPLQFISGRP
jgi:hypothetical protein